jgi:GTP diphosphokinase / guanosine-3',5'-bis(diphosphate) 3'-diphosphatase
MEVKDKTVYDYSSLDKKVDKIVKVSTSYLLLPQKIIDEQVKKAYLYARSAHEGQIRLSGEPYIYHPVEATIILLDLNPDLATIQSCLLHDVVEDTPRTLEDIAANF